MPELPEVHTIVQELKQVGLIGCSIEKALVFWPRTIASSSPSIFCHLIAHKKILGFERRGKYLIFLLSDNLYLCIHLRMTGKLLLADQNSVNSPYIRVLLNLDNGKTLYYHDTRKFGRWHLVQNLEEVVSKIGPEPLSKEFTFEVFWKRIHVRSRALKPLLLDQTFLAGLGNIYVDEALWEAGLHPLQPAYQLTSQQAQLLYQAIIYVLQRGIDSGGTTLGTGRTNYYRLDGSRGEHQLHLNVFRRTGQKCSRCNHLIERLIVSQRSTHICLHCQPLLLEKK